MSSSASQNPPDRNAADGVEIAGSPVLSALLEERRRLGYCPTLDDWLADARRVLSEFAHRRPSARRRGDVEQILRGLTVTSELLERLADPPASGDTPRHPSTSRRVTLHVPARSRRLGLDPAAPATASAAPR